jgi:phosphoenolpyruvate---glycerone phosphotransferase subunit DhaL
MPIHCLSVEQAKQWFILLSQAMIDEQDTLTRADQAVGDGDHGIGISRGFSAVNAKFRESEFTTLDLLVNSVGKTLLMSIGGASGAIFGSLFMGGAKSLKDKTEFDAGCLADLLEGGLRAVVDRGKAGVGDKTIVDALQPAAKRARQVQANPLDKALVEVVTAAEEGLESTRNLQARFGKARPLGERAIGHLDPGALSFTLMLRHLSRLLSHVGE